MKPTRIMDVLDLAYEARKLNETLIPLFTGAAGLGKSEICQQWVDNKRKTQRDFGFIDLRLAYKEGPDLLGRTRETLDKSGRSRTFYSLPDFWPTEGEGLLFLEEPNRAPTMVTNCLMQLLTDRKIEGYTLPPGWIIAGAINPDSAEYDVNSMDTALRDRFVEFEVEYDGAAFMEFMEKKDWCPHIQHFVKSGAWTYKDASGLGKDSRYISPRSWSRLNAGHKAGAAKDKTMHRILCVGVLGKEYGNELWKFMHDDAPVMAKDLIHSKAKALKKLKEQTKDGHYQGDKISVTVDSVIANYGGDKDVDEKGEKLITQDVMVEVARIIHSDQAVTMIKACGLKCHSSNFRNFLKDLGEKYPDMIEIIKANIKIAGIK